MSQVIVIGGGAAGMMAAIRAAEGGRSVLLLEKNEKLGKKLYITGKGRCNLTNACDTEELFRNVMRNPKFLYPAFYTFSNWQTMAFFEEQGMPVKTERGERVFPASDHASDVIAALRKRMETLGVTVRLHTEAAAVLTKQRHVTGVRLADGRTLTAQRVVVATGGRSYPSTGSTGDGYRFAEELGHSVTKQYPSLVPFDTEETWPRKLQGLALKNVGITIEKDGKPLYNAFGEMLFTHFGVSGPMILSTSSVLNDYADKMPLALYLDLKPALSKEQLDARLLREFGKNQNKALKNAVGSLFPVRLTPVMIAVSGIDPEKKVHEVTREERLAFGSLIKGLPITLTRLRDFKEAIITRGGVSVKEVNPSTMESKLVKGLYFAGELLDVDALTGGYNLQIAWSTGYLAGASMDKEETE